MIQIPAQMEIAFSVRAGRCSRWNAPENIGLLLANKRNHAVELKLPDAAKAHILTIDESTGDEPARTVSPAETIRLEPFAVSVVSW